MNAGFEPIISQSVTDYLMDVIDAAITDTCPAVCFVDSMALDEAHRIVTFCPGGVNQPDSPGNIVADVQVMVKSQWTEATYASDMIDHWQRVAHVRGALMASDLTTQLAAKTDGDKLGIYHADVGKTFTTNIDQEGHWITSETQFKVKCYLPEAGT